MKTEDMDNIIATSEWKGYWESLINENTTLRADVAAYKAMLFQAQTERDVARATVVKLEAEVVSLREAAVHIYNSGYSAGHHYTVEGSYVDIHSSDMDSYHAEDVAELLAALVGEDGR